jgi:hypothetical protein
MTTATIERTRTLGFGTERAATVRRAVEDKTTVVYERPAEERRSGAVVYNVTPEAAFGSIVIRALEMTGAATARELARYTGISELIVRSVLQALAAVDVLDFDRPSGRYSLYCELPR